jgi:polar amino acid transport system permease protein
MSYQKTLGKIILPQALFNCLPSMMNQFVLIVKNTSLAYIVGARELTFYSSSVNAQLLTKPFQVYLILAAIYFCLCFSLSRFTRMLEGRIVRRRLGLIADKAEGGPSLAGAPS